MSESTLAVAIPPRMDPGAVATLELVAPDEPDAAADERTPLWYKALVLTVVVVPMLGLVAAALLTWGWGFDWVYLAMLVGGWLLTGMGITVGFHRYFTHKSFEARKPVTMALGVLGSMAMQGPILVWAQNHRRHHRHSDKEGDVHSPHLHEGGLTDWAKGAWHSHVGWMLERQKDNLRRWVPDLMADRSVRFLHRTFWLWAGLGLVIPALLGWAIAGDWRGALLGFLWGGLARVFVVHHVTWSVNSICHLFGTRAYRSSDHSRNNAIMGILALGEGWHNNHHAFPASARHGLAWWQIDLSYMAIKAMSWVGLTWNVRVPDRERREAKRRTKGDAPNR